MSPIIPVRWAGGCLTSTGQAIWCGQKYEPQANGDPCWSFQGSVRGGETPCDPEEPTGLVVWLWLHTEIQRYRDIQIYMRYIP